MLIILCFLRTYSVKTEIPEEGNIIRDITNQMGTEVSKKCNVHLYPSIPKEMNRAKLNILIRLMKINIFNVKYLCKINFVFLQQLFLAVV